MSLCRLLVLDFLHGTGRYDPVDGERYDDCDLAYAVEYAEDRLAAGYVRDSVDGFDLAALAAWCRKTKAPRRQRSGGH